MNRSAPRRCALGVAPLVFYREAVRLAQALAVRERQRLRHTLAQEEDDSWLERVALLLDEWHMPVAMALGLVEIWAVPNPLLPGPRRTGPPPQDRPARGRYRRLPMAAPHTNGMLEATLGKRSCLPWQLGEMITTELLPAPGGWRLGGRA
ncbi:hypothetical protein ACFXJ5_36315 [Streptomyces sp. NPDC059373]